MSVRITLIVVDQDDPRHTSELRVERDTRSLAIAAMVTLLSTLDRLPVDHNVRPVDTPDTSLHDQQTPQLKCRHCLTPLLEGRRPGVYLDVRALDDSDVLSIPPHRHEPIDDDHPGPCAFCGAQLLRTPDGRDFTAPSAGDGVGRQVCPGRVNGRHKPYDPPPIGNCSTCGKALRSIGSPGNVVALDGSVTCEPISTGLHVISS